MPAAVMVVIVIVVVAAAAPMPVFAVSPAVAVPAPEFSAAVVPHGHGVFALGGGQDGVKLGEFGAHEGAHRVAALLAHGEDFLRVGGG